MPLDPGNLRKKLQLHRYRLARNLKSKRYFPLIAAVPTRYEIFFCLPERVRSIVDGKVRGLELMLRRDFDDEVYARINREIWALLHFVL